MATLEGLLASLLNPNPGVQRAGLLGPNAMAQTGLGPDQLQRYHAMSGLGGGQAMPAPQAAPPAPSMPQQAPQAPDQMQTASTAPAGARSSFGLGGLGDAIGGLFNPKGAQKNRTVQLLMQEGLDEGTARLYAGNKQALNQYLLLKSQGQKPIEVNGKLVDPNTYKVLADFSSPGNRQTTTIDGKLVDTNTGQVIGDYGGGAKTRVMTAEEVDAAGLPPGVYQQDEKGKIDAVGSVRDQDAGFKNEMELRKQYDMLPEVKDYKIVRSNYERIRAGSQQGTGAGDVAIVFGYMKMLDPTSVVREGEQATASNAAGVPEAVRGLYNQLSGGGTLSAEARQQILAAAEKVYGDSSANIEDVNKRYSEFATNYKLDPNRIVSQPERYDQPAQPGGGGSSKSFTDQKQVIEAIQNGTLKIGDEIIFNGERMRVDP